MSYASVTSHNIPFGEMPKPDQGLADGDAHISVEHHHVEGDSKMQILPPGSDPEHPDYANVSPVKPEPLELHPAETYNPYTSAAAPKPAAAPHKHDVHIPESGADYEKARNDTEKEAEKKIKETKKEDKGTGKNLGNKAKETGKDVEKKGKELKSRAQEELNDAEDRFGPYWEKTKDVVLRPGTLGGLLGAVNVGVLGTIGYFACTRREQTWDRRIVGSAVAGTLALFGAEGFLADSYLSTAEGQEEAERAKREGSKLYLQAKEIVLRPDVAGGLAGAFNVAVISTVGYFSYKHWNQRWDQRIVGGVTAGLLALSGLEGYAGKVYKDKELPKH